MLPESGSGCGRRVLATRFCCKFGSLAYICKGMGTRRNRAGRKGHEAHLLHPAFRFGSLNEALLAMGNVVMSLRLSCRPMLRLLLNVRGRFVRREDDKIIAACMTDRIAGRSQLIDHFTKYRRGEAQDVIASRNPIGILECLKMV